ncbi:sugar transferase [Dietzia kunjamensis]|uniref:sugar transferase n=1 Tax=Dietzia kunjamensis TaxID=322509 RepID=UPI002097BDCA|nr:sugar transferase [Dietzia kunjamensis]USX45195.1 sugar transferase [Dietzia kunjamensis]
MSYQGKRALDLTLSVPLLILSLPIQALAALAIRISMGSPVLFKQTRPGKDARPITVRKFRTMRPVDRSRGWVEDGSRLTRVGSFLRSTSVDELPTLLSVVRGEMSLVGPRPLLMAYLERYNPQQARRMEVLPGLTGLAQVNGRNAQSWDERFAWDIQYVETASLKLDLKILLRTIISVARREGISAQGQATMAEFRGVDG